MPGHEMKYKQIPALLLTRHICLLQFMLPFEELKRTRKCTPIKYAWKCYSIPLARQYASVVPLIFWKRYGIFIHARDFFDGLTAIWRLSKFNAQASFDLAGLLHFRDSSQKNGLNWVKRKWESLCCWRWFYFHFNCTQIILWIKLFLHTCKTNILALFANYTKMKRKEKKKVKENLRKFDIFSPNKVRWNFKMYFRIQSVHLVGRCFQTERCVYTLYTVYCMMMVMVLSLQITRAKPISTA